MRSFASAVGVLRAPIVVVFCAAVLLFLPSQSREIFQGIWRATGADFYIEFARSAFAFLVYTVVILCTTVLLLDEAATFRKDNVAKYTPFIEALALALPAIPLLTVLFTYIDVHFEKPWLSPEAWTSIIEIVAFVAWSAIVFFLKKNDRLRTQIFAAVEVFIAPLRKLNWWVSLLIVAVCIAVLVVLSVNFPRYFATILGPLGTICLFFSLLLASAALLTNIYDRRQLPILSGLVVIAVLSAHFGTNDNHHLRLLQTAAAPPPSFHDAFKAWLKSRHEIKDHPDKAYPVYIVSAEGGGVYAAAHAAFALASMQDYCPAFAHHLFAISGVSGGSLGAAVFATLLQTQPRPKDAFVPQGCSDTTPASTFMQEAVTAYFSQDLFTPLLAFATFPDFLQRFIPRGVPAFDRGRGLELAFEEAWSKVAAERKLDRNALQQDVRKIWTSDGDVPALLLNATAVRSGDRAIIAPFTLKTLEPGASDFRDLATDILNGRYSVRLSTAVGASARFPVVSPPASLMDKPFGELTQLVDGGYYENSGIETAADLVQHLQDGARETKPVPSFKNANGCASNNLARFDLGDYGVVHVCFKFIVIRSINMRIEYPFYDELSAPILALYNTRGGHGLHSQRVLDRIYCGGMRCGKGREAVNPHQYLQAIDVRGLPLGWYISNATVARIRAAMIPPDGCIGRAESQLGEISNVQFAREECSCIYGRIYRDISGFEGD